MGLCCNCNEDVASRSDEARRKPRNETSLSQSQLTLDSDSFDVSQVLGLQRKLSVLEKREKIECFLSYKENMKFKIVACFGEHYSLSGDLGEGSFC